MAKNKYEEKMRETLGDWLYLNEYKEYPELGEIYLEVDSDDVNFDLLEKLSKAFNTKNINLGSVTREEGYCETCWYTGIYTTIRIGGVNF